MKIAIITGASSGMGREAARQLADRFSGLQEVWLIARRMDRMQELERTLPIPARCFTIDLTDASQRETLENELAARKPNVKILVNASGFGKIGTVGNLPLDDETGMVELNCKALCAVTHMVLPYMSENSRILQFASAASFLPQPGFAIYAANQGICLKLQPRPAGRTPPAQNRCDGGLPRPVKTEFSTLPRQPGRFLFISVW